MDKENVERTIAVRIQNSLFTAFEQKCKREYKTVSEMVRQLIAEYMKSKGGE
jgi:metal-responsive CopG/Arc/MetJ family transcriptional regulator